MLQLTDPSVEICDARSPFLATMPWFPVLVVAFARTVRAALRDPEYRGLVLFVALVLATGTAFYRSVEGWSWLDALDFAVVTLTTVGYGDLAPQSVAGRAFTIVFILVGLGAFTAFVTALAGKQRERFRDRGPAPPSIDGTGRT